MTDIILLGSGDTLGTPVFGSDAASNATERRTRFGLLVRHGGKTLLVEANPDLKWQCLSVEFALSEVDAVLLTHTHSDHLNGMGEFWQRREQPTIVYHPSDPISQRNIDYFRYLEKERVLIFKTYGGYEPFLLWGGCIVTPVEMNHGFPCWGFLIDLEGKRIGIVSDSCAALADRSLGVLQRCDLLFVDAFSENFAQVQQHYKELREPTPDINALKQQWFHMTIHEAFDLHRRIQAKTACTVHMSRFMSCQAELVRKYQSDSFFIGYDGFRLEL